MDDFKKVPESVEELDAMLEEEFKEEPSNENEVATEGEFDDEDSTDELETEEVEETEEIKETEEVEESDDESKEYLEDDVKAKPSKKESKTDYAFKKLRQEARELKKKSSSYENFINEMDAMARVYGYKDSKEMLEAMRQKQMEEEARARNIDPEIYKELQEQKRRIAEIEREKLELIQKQKAENFVKILDNFAKEYKLTESEINQIITNMDEDGWNLDNIKNPERLIKGYAADIIAERKTQKVLKQMKDEEKFVEKPFKNQGEAPQKSIDDLVNEDLAKFAKERGLPFEKIF